MQAMTDLISWTRRLLVERRYFWLIACSVFTFDAILTAFIIRFVPYTEIDWETYMVHVDLYEAGELDYSKITGPTGFLVYPAGHLHIHRWLSAVTNGGLNIMRLQQIYATLYLVSLALSLLLYWRMSAPNWTLMLLPLSKRLHSIYMLRLFNDCWATVVMQTAILAYSFESDVLGTLFFSLALSVKMSILLYLPVICLLLTMRRGLIQTVCHVLGAVIIQAIIAGDFLQAYPWSYIAGAFDLSRQFLYKWTVNWKFVSEETFLKQHFATTLLFCHLITLSIFCATKWTHSHRGLATLVPATLMRPAQPASRLPVSSQMTIQMLFEANLIGMTFARSLHYQFYSWCSYQLPALASGTVYFLPFKIILLGFIEIAWNTYPATKWSSALLVGSHLALLIGTLISTTEGLTRRTQT